MTGDRTTRQGLHAPLPALDELPAPDGPSDPEQRGPRVLVADDDAQVAELVRLCLEIEDFAVDVVHDGPSVLERVRAELPDVVLLDVMMPGLDGVEVLRRLRADAATTALPVVLLTARGLSADKVLGLTAGADDYIVKPFDPAELVARLRATLRRTADARAVSPLTGLPGNTRVDREIRSRAASGQPYAVSHVDLDEFKSFNDTYGFLRGDGLLRALATCLLDAAAGESPPVFVGHVGGDDFVLVSTPQQAEPVAGRALERFDALVREHYDEVDRARGHLVVRDRRGELRPHALVSVSVGVAWHRDGDTDHREVVAAATEMKAYAKSQPGSLVAVDRRR